MNYELLERHKSHQLRITNFRKVLDTALSSKMASMKDEQNTLRRQLESVRSADDDPRAIHGNLAELHAQQFSMGRVASPKKGKKHNKSRSDVLMKKKRSRRNSMASDDGDTSSVDSEVDLVYTKGTKLSRHVHSENVKKKTLKFFK